MIDVGELIVLEGPDEVGKSTLARELGESLASCGVMCEVLSFPGKEEGTLGRLVYDLHHDLEQFGVRSLDPASLQLLHVAAHVDIINRRILPDLAAGKWVILDRFWWSTWVYGVISGVSRRTLKGILRSERDLWQDIKPACVFLVHRNTQQLSKSHSRLVKEYVRLAKRESRSYPVKDVHNERSVDEAVAVMLEAIRELIWPVSKEQDQESKQWQAFGNGNLQLELSDDQQSPSGNGDEDSRRRSLIMFSRLSAPQPSEVYDTYWRFAAERQAIFFRRFRNEHPPWTNDPILHRYKFTNAYRASDRVSQYMIRNVLYHGEQSVREVFFRTLIFKVFNRIDTWELLSDKLGEVRYSDYSFDVYDNLLTRAMESGSRIFSAAYMMPSGSGELGGTRKHRCFIRLIERMVKDDLPQRIAESPNMQEAYERVLDYPMIGGFLAYQYVTDLNYSTITDFFEMEFVMPGPGAKSGIHKCFTNSGDMTESDIVRWVADHQEEEFDRLGLRFESLWGRPLQLIDCQNLFCEVDKYARIAHPRVKGIGARTRIKQPFAMTADSIDYWYPPKWGLNDLIKGG